MNTPRISKFIGGLGLVSALGIAISACGSPSSNPPSTSTSNAAAAKSAIRHENLSSGPTRVLVKSQHSAGDVVTVTSVTLPEVSPTRSGKVEGYVVLAADLATKPGDVLGYAPVTEHKTKNIQIHVSTKLTSGSYFVLLDPNGVDPTKPGKQLKQAMITVSVP